MDVENFAGLYASKTDEEIVILARERQRLTPAAQLALDAELATRRLHLQSEQAHPSRPPAPVHGDGSPSQLLIGTFIQEVLRFYNGKRWFFLKLILPAVLLGYASLQLARYESHRLLRHALENVRLLESKLFVYQVTALMDGGYFISWMAFCLSFAAICSGTEQIGAGFEPSVRESFGSVRERLWPTLRLSLVLLACFLVFETAVFALLFGGVVPPLSKFVARMHRPMFDLVVFAFWAPSLIVLSRLSLAMPAVVLDDDEVLAAVWKSRKLSRGKSHILAILLFKSIVGGYVAGMLPFWLARLILADAYVPYWFNWVLTLASVALVAVVEPIMFIGLALLYLKATDAPAKPQAQAAAI